MDTVFHLNGHRTFTRAEAQRLLPIILKITERHKREVMSLVHRIEKGDAGPELEVEVDRVMEQWRSQVTRLGGKPAGAWIVDFDNGEGYYCWKFPETHIQFHHGYKSSSRRRLGEMNVDADAL